MEKKKEIIKNIVEMIEDKTYPARRGIMDYIQHLIEQYTDNVEARELYDYAQNLFAENDKK